MTDNIVEAFLIAVPWLSAWAAWVVASWKDRRPWPWALLAFVLPIIGLIVIAVAPDRKGPADYMKGYRSRGI